MKKNPAILIVDDEPDVLEAFCMMLEDRGHLVFTAINRQEALRAIEEQEIGVCLVDLKMKEDDGLQVSRELLKKDDLIRIIIITAYPNYDSAVDAIKMGIFDYVSKTADPREILGKIDRALEARGSVMASKSKFVPENRESMILVCHHTLTREGIEKFCHEFPPYNLLHTYHSYGYIRQNDFNSSAQLLLLCLDCFYEKRIMHPERMFSSLRLYFPNAHPMVINSNLSDKEKIQLIRYGVRGFLSPNIGKGNMKEALDVVLKEGMWVSRELSNRLLNEYLEDYGQDSYQKPAEFYKLSRREIEILRAMASGLSNSEICEKLFISENTVKVHINHIFKKLEVKSRTQAVMKAVDCQII